MDMERNEYIPEESKQPVFTGGEKYSAEPVIEKSIGNFWYWFGMATEKIGQKRVTFAMRRERADLYWQAKEARKTEIGSMERRKSIDDFETHTRIEKEFVDQKDLRVETPWGKQEAKYVILNMEVDNDKPPMVIIPGASNGVESMDSFVRELAKQYPDRKIILIGYPDAPSGKMTSEFFEAIKSADGVEPHSAYFVEAIKKILPEGDFELGSYSVGGAIAETILSGGVLSDRVTNAWLINPGGSVEIHNDEFRFAIAHENGSLLKFLKDIPRYVFVDDKTRDEQKKMKFATWAELGKRCCRNLTDDLIGKMKTKEGGKILVISGSEDEMTKAARKFNSETLPYFREKQANLEVSVISQSIHAGPFVEPNKYIDEIKRKIR